MFERLECTMNKTTNYKVWDTKTKQMFQVAGIDYVQGEIYPVTGDEDKRFIALSEGILLPQTPFVDSEDNMKVLSDFLRWSDGFKIVGNIYENADLIANSEQTGG